MLQLAAFLSLPLEEGLPSHKSMQNDNRGPEALDEAKQSVDFFGGQIVIVRFVTNLEVCIDVTWSVTRQPCWQK